MAIEFKCPQCKQKVLAKFGKAGDRIKCTLCGYLVTIPPDSVDVVEIPNLDQEKVEVAQSVTTFEGGKESLLQGWAGFILFLGIVALIASVIASGFVKNDSSYDDWAENGFDWSLIMIGLTAFIQSVLTWLVLAGGAEIIRLLKKLNGLNFGGSISNVTAVYTETEESYKAGWPNT